MLCVCFGDSADLELNRLISMTNETQNRYLGIIPLQNNKQNKKWNI